MEKGDYEDNEDYDEERYEEVLEESFSVYSCTLFFFIIKLGFCAHFVLLFIFTDSF